MTGRQGQRLPRRRLGHQFAHRQFRQRHLPLLLPARVASYASITDFTIGQDTIELEKSSFAGIGGKGKLGASQFFMATDYAGEAGAVIYDKATGVLSYSATGGTLANAIQFGDVAANLNLKNSDFLLV